jgi:NADPH:quinone reductase-like Zn-dependent oxidoreductase
VLRLEPVKRGKFKSFLRYRLPLILGHDVAGVVVRVGSRVHRFKPGDEVYARPADGRIGAFAEFIAIKEDDVAIKPTALTMAEAASIPLVGLTAWQALSKGRTPSRRACFALLNRHLVQVRCSFLFMRANGGQLAKITALIDAGIIRPVVDRVFPFASTKEAMAYVEAGRAKGKVVVSVRES